MVIKQLLSQSQAHYQTSYGSRRNEGKLALKQKCFTSSPLRSMRDVSLIGIHISFSFCSPMERTQGLVHVKHMKHELPLQPFFKSFILRQDFLLAKIEKIRILLFQPLESLNYKYELLCLAYPPFVFHYFLFVVPIHCWGQIGFFFSLGSSQIRCTTNIQLEIES